MKLSDYREIFEYGKIHNITIGGFNSVNLETLQGIVEAANEMVKLGIAKLKVGTELFDAYKKAIFDIFSERGWHTPPEEIIAMARNAVKETAKKKIKLLTAFRR